MQGFIIKLVDFEVLNEASVNNKELLNEILKDGIKIYENQKRWVLLVVARKRCKFYYW